MNASSLSMLTAGIIMLVTARGQALPIGAAMPAADLTLTGLDGLTLTLADIKGPAGTLVVFTCNHCPFVKAWEARLVQIANRGVDHELGVVFVNSNDPVAFPEDSPEQMKKLARDQGYKFPYVVDGTSALARAFGASRTPEAYLFDGAGKLVYHGAIDDSPYDAAKATRPYLKEALDALLAGKPIPEAETKSVGCSIKFRSPAGK